MRDLRELLGEGLDLPVGGVTYHVMPPTGRVGMRLQTMRDLSAKAAGGIELSKADKKRLQLDDAAERDFYADTLGATYKTMVDGGCTSYEIRLAASSAYLYFTAADPVTGLEDVERFLANQDPRRTATEQKTPEIPSTPDGKASASTAAASTTRAPNSGSGTTSRKASPPRAAKTAKALRSVS